MRTLTGVEQGILVACLVNERSGRGTESSYEYRAPFMALRDDGLLAGFWPRRWYLTDVGREIAEEIAATSTRESAGLDEHARPSAVETLTPKEAMREVRVIEGS